MPDIKRPPPLPPPITSLSDCLDCITRSEEFLKEFISEQTSDWFESERGVAFEEIQESLETLIADFQNALSLPKTESNQEEE